MKSTSLCFISLFLLGACVSEEEQDEGLVDPSYELVEPSHQHEEKSLAAISHQRRLAFATGLDGRERAEKLQHLGNLFYSHGQLDSARHYYVLSVQQVPRDSYEYLVNMADVDAMDGRVWHAIQVLQALTIKHGDLYDAYYSLALIRLGNYGDEFADSSEALVLAKKAYKLAPEWETRETLGAAYLKNRNYFDALQIYRQLSLEKPEFAEYAFCLGRIYRELGDTKSASEWFHKTIELDPDYRDKVSVLLK